MEIFGSAQRIGWRGVEKLHDKIAKVLPDVYINRYDTTDMGFISGYSSPSFFRTLFIVYYYHNIAIVNKNFRDESHLITGLKKLGYHVRSAKFGSGNGAHGLFWDEMRKGGGEKFIKENMENLLKPILSKIGGVKQYEFAVYKPFPDLPSDYDGDPHFMAFASKKDLFRLPVLDNGLPDLDMVIKKLKAAQSGMAVALSSRVETASGNLHIPMIDFMTSGVDLEDILNMMKELNIPNEFLVNSGNSYHHYNPKNLLTEEKFYAHLEMLANRPEVGKHWPELQMVQAYSLLRIVPCIGKTYFPEIEDVSKIKFIYSEKDKKISI